MNEPAIPPTAPTTLAILLGASAWPKSPGFQASEAFVHAAQGFKNYLLDPHRWGLPIANLLDLFDAQTSASDQLEVLGSFLEERAQVQQRANQAVRDVLVYFVGHGGFAGPSADFYLLLRRTNASSLRASGMAIDALAEVLREKARQMRRYLFLDCCFAAAAFRSFQGGPDQTAIMKTLDAFAVRARSSGFPRKGTVLLCSSDQKTPSQLLPDESCTMFSYALLDVLKNGDLHRQPQLSLRDIKELAEDRLAALSERNAPRPHLHSPDQSEGDVADVPFFPNPYVERERARLAEEGRRRQAEEEKRRRLEEERTRKAEEEQVRKAREEQARKAAEQGRIRKAREEEAQKAAEQATSLAQLEPKIRDRVGQIFGNYRILRLLGTGGFAEVYLSMHIRLNTQAAIKVLHMQLADEETQDFLNEARTIARLDHPNIVRVMDFDVQAGIPFLVMTYAPNGTLRQRHPVGQRLPLATIVPYVKQVADALQYAHESKLIHRDIKPENMLVGRRNEILVSDFGIMISGTSGEFEQEMAGIADYMAPEQIMGLPGPESDQYALGVVVYEWLSGDRPFRGSFTEIVMQHLHVPPPPLREKLPSLSPAVEQVVMVTLAKDPKQRFGSIQAFATALEQASQLRK